MRSPQCKRGMKQALHAEHLATGSPTRTIATVGSPSIPAAHGRPQRTKHAGQWTGKRGERPTRHAGVRHASAQLHQGASLLFDQAPEFVHSMILTWNATFTKRAGARMCTHAHSCVRLDTSTSDKC